MTNGEKSEELGIPPSVREGIDFDVLPSAKPIGGETKDFFRTVLSSRIEMSEAEFAGPDEPKARIVNGILQVDKSAVDAEEERVIAHYAERIKATIVAGDQSGLNKLLWFIADQETPQAKELIAQIEAAFQLRDADSLKLDSLEVVLPKRTMAERRVIKEEMRRQLKERFPFGFKDTNRTPLRVDPERMDVPGPNNQVDFILVQEGRHFKLVVAAEKGIGPVTFSDPDSGNLPPQYYRYPKPDAWTKKQDGTLLIPVNAAGDGSEPLFSLIEIRREPMKLTDKLVEEEEEVERQTYAPPSPSVPTRQPLSPRSSRPTYYVSTSG